MYKSPIEIIEGQIKMQMEANILKAVHEVGINVDKPELLRALQYDRAQYSRGYQDAMEACLLEFITYIDRAFDRQLWDSSWINEKGELQSADVGYGGEWWSECMKPELIRVFALGGENEK